MSKPRSMTIALDFDGVVHAYRKGWQGGEIYDDVTPGFFDWAVHASTAFRLVIHSSRFAGEDGKAQLMAARAWLKRQANLWALSVGSLSQEAMDAIDGIEFSAEKPPAWVSIDDRCIRFEGNWSAPELGRGALLGYRPWNQRKASS